MASIITTPSAATVDIVVRNIMSSDGWTNINGLTTNWDDSSNTLTMSFSNATNTSFPTIDHAGPSQADYTEVVNFVLNEIGYSNISGLSTSWNTSSNILNFSFNSAISKFIIFFSNIWIFNTMIYAISVNMN